MTKSTSKVIDTIVPAEATQPQLPPLPAKRPYAVQIMRPVDQALAEAAVLIRHHGYTLCSSTSAQIFGATGVIALTLVQGPCDEAYVPSAEAAMAEAAAAEQRQYDRDVAAEVARQLKAKVDAEIAERKAAAIAEHKRKIAELDAEFEATQK